MFYSHEILTSRKYGVATIWLVATLGSKSSLKKVSRKAILDVNVRKACETIVTPDAPMALRLQSNLLYGVTRVYSQQCGYVLNDVESARNNMRALFDAVQAAELEPEGVHQAKAEQLVLRSDPNFVLDLDLVPVNINTLLQAIPAAVDSQESYLSPQASQAFSSSSPDIGGLLIPPSNSPSVGQPTGRMDNWRVPEDSEAGLQLESARLLEDDLGLIIDPDGTVRMSDLPPSQPPPEAAAPSNTFEGLQIGGEDQPMHDAINPVQGMAEGIASAEDDAALLSDPADLDFAQPGLDLQQQKSTSESAQASIRPQKRRSKTIPLDRTTELHNSDFSRWSANYLSDMKDMMRLKEIGRMGALAKQNAQFWVLGPMQDIGANVPLSIFTGARLLEAFTGLQLLPGGQKRLREEDEQSDDQGRRVRSREDTLGAETGRGAQGDADLDNDYIAPADDNDVEMGRNAPTPLDDRLLSNTFPWNQSAASRRPSNIPSSGSFTAAGPQLSMISRRASRMVSASPLLGRGILSGQEMEDVYFPDPGVASTDDGDFELYGPDVATDTQADLQSPWQRAAMNGESENFLAFVQSAIADANLVHQQLESAEEGVIALTDSIDFETLLPPESNNVIVAAQAMVNMLVLGTKGLLNIQQDEIFGPISLRIPSAV